MLCSFKIWKQINLILVYQFIIGTAQKQRIQTAIYENNVRVICQTLKNSTNFK